MAPYIPEKKFFASMLLLLFGYYITIFPSKSVRSSSKGIYVFLYKYRIKSVYDGFV